MGSRAIEFAGLAVLLHDELESLPVEESDFVLVTGAHAGLSSARRILRRPPRLVVFNDAGVGKDNAGIAGLELLDGFNIAAAAVAADSARIGDASDTLENGRISHCNEHAVSLGLKPGDSVREALDRIER